MGRLVEVDTVHRRVRVDGVDMTDQLVAVDVHIDAGWRSTVTLTLCATTMASLVLSDATVKGLSPDL
jgi:hypothetical protein